MIGPRKKVLTFFVESQRLWEKRGSHMTLYVDVGVL
ncbi:hypothetical protein OROMI_013289 [Orobanche minor]